MTRPDPTEPVALSMERERRLHPPAQWARLREQTPVRRLRYPDGHLGWLVSSHALAKAVLTDARFSMQPARSLINAPEKSARILGELMRDPAFRANFLRLDPPEHTRVRRLLAKQFTVRAVGEYRPQIERVVADRLDAVEQAGPGVDLLEAFAVPIALWTHCALWGIPDEDAPRLRRRAEIIVSGDVGAQEQIDDYWSFRDYLHGLMQQRRAQPTDDLTSFVAHLDELTDDEIVGVLVLMFDAGFETTAASLALGTFALLCHPQQWDALVADPALARGAVEELLRYLTIFHYGAFTRTAREDVELDGVTIAAGDTVTVSLAAANRDPARFEEPDLLDIARNAAGQLAFGHGVHVCLGQHQARLEMQIAFAELARRFPTLRLAVPVEQVPLTDARHLIYTVGRLPVVWDDAAAA